MDFKNTYPKEKLTAKEIADIRKSLEMNCYQFSKFFGVSHAIIPIWERGETTPTYAISELIRIKTSPEYLEANQEEVSAAKFLKTRPEKYRKKKKEDVLEKTA